jgi:hypothetical protein
MNEKALESFISTCESMMIAEEGASWDAWKMYVSQDFKEIKRSFRSAKKYAKVQDFEKAKAELGVCVDKAMDLKKKVDEIPEQGKVANFFSNLNPLLSFIKSSEFTGVTPGIGYQYGGGSSGPVLTLDFNYTSYTDALSKRTSNAVKRDVQLAINLIIKRCDRIEYAMDHLDQKKLKKNK